MNGDIGKMQQMVAACNAKQFWQVTVMARGKLPPLLAHRSLAPLFLFSRHSDSGVDVALVAIGAILGRNNLLKHQVHR
jgi:hypothetical protein